MSGVDRGRSSDFWRWRRCRSGLVFSGNTCHGFYVMNCITREGKRSREKEKKLSYKNIGHKMISDNFHLC